jgi:hypothetical protein
MKILLTAFIYSLSINLFSQCMDNESDFKKYFIENSANLDPIEGIWSISWTGRVYDIYGNLLARDKSPQSTQEIIIRNGNEFISCPNKTTSSSPIFKSTFQRTAADGIYIYSKLFYSTSETAKANATLNKGLLEAKICASNRSTNAKAARLQPTSKAVASVLLRYGGQRHCA